MTRTRWALVGAALVAAGAVAGFGWHYSDMILGPDRPPTLHEQHVLAIEPGRIRLGRDHESLEPGRWALEWANGYGAVGRVLSSDSASVVREFRALVGDPPVGAWASLRGVARSADPLKLLGLTYESVAIAGPLGRYPAWWVPGRKSVWVIYVHGRGANRTEGLRTLGVLAARGVPGLMVTYRNDAGAPASPDGYYHLGLTEWGDLEAAVRYALGHGARGVVLSGYSMGGQIVLQFMHRSPLASRVRAIVLESPVLDWNATLALRARVLHVPAAMTWIGKRTAALRAGIDWEQLDQVPAAVSITTPILLFHNLEDRFAPEWVSEAFAKRSVGYTTLVRVARGNHVEAWNADSSGYAIVLNRWFTAHGL